MEKGREIRIENPIAIYIFSYLGFRPSQFVAHRFAVKKGRLSGDNIYVGLLALHEMQQGIILRDPSSFHARDKKEKND